MRYLLLALVMVVPLRSFSQSYQWITEFEHPEEFPNDILYFKAQDTLRGNVHSNDWFTTNATFGLPVFYGDVSTARPSFRPGSPNPPAQFLGNPPVYETNPVEIPTRLDDLRQSASYHLVVAGHQWYVSINGAQAVCYHWPEGTALDTLTAQSTSVNLSPSVIIFIFGKVDVRGVIAPNGCHFILGCSGDLRIIGNVMLQGTQNGHLPANSTSSIGLASEGSVLVGNTWENGRENSSQGSDVVITAMIAALGGSFTFEQQNDEGDPYICDCVPDERGTVYINGGIIQRYRGYFHRSNNGGTGYQRKLLFEERVQYWPNAFFPSLGSHRYPDSLFFADTPVGSSTIDTVTIIGGHSYSGALTTYPFHAPSNYEYGSPFIVPVTFAPPNAGVWNGFLTFFLDGVYHDIALRGVGVSSAPPIAPEIFPNPFNNVTSLSFTLPEAAHVRATVYDVTGRAVTELMDNHTTAGSHTLQFDGANLSSGVYFLRFTAGEQISTHKLLLIK